MLFQGGQDKGMYRQSNNLGWSLHGKFLVLAICVASKIQLSGKNCNCNCSDQTFAKWKQTTRTKFISHISSSCQKFLPSSTFFIILTVLCKIESNIPATVKTPPIMAQTLVIKCQKDLGFSVIRTCIGESSKWNLAVGM
ncbi:hypothetical protein OIU84_003121 [Salix udensis]|uniref:Uncharacterized protein n=1 Tax=Salix udensis TaxID=889485 RepID=A0AAD6P5B0_9ROSI|nr:hypothetical protein OIU84_003121 [Salix udensis]